MYYKAELNKSTPSSHTGFRQLYIWKLHVLCLKSPCWVLQGMQATQQTHPGTSTALHGCVRLLEMEFPNESATKTFQPQFVCFATEISTKPSVALFFWSWALYFFSRTWALLGSSDCPESREDRSQRAQGTACGQLDCQWCPVCAMRKLGWEWAGKWNEGEERRWGRQDTVRRDRIDRWRLQR